MKAGATLNVEDIGRRKNDGGEGGLHNMPEAAQEALSRGELDNKTVLDFLLVIDTVGLVSQTARKAGLQLRAVRA